MGFLRRVLGLEQKEDVRTSLELFREIYGGGRDSMAGVVVNLQTALEAVTVLACARILAEGVAQVPMHLHQEVSGRVRTATDHRLDGLLYRQPKRGQTAFEFRESLMFHLVLTGNAFVFVNRVGTRREVAELDLIEPGRVTVRKLLDGRVEYTVRGDDGRSQVFPRDSIWHLRGPSWNTWLGLDSTKLARNAIGLAVSLEQGQAEFQKNGARPSANYSVAERLSPERFEFLAKWLDRHVPGGDRYGKPVITDMGAKFTSMVMSAVDQQLIETRKHQIEEICRAFRIMPLMVGHPAEMAARAATESIFLQHVVHTLMPWYQRIEQSADVNLLTEEELAAGYRAKLNPNALMRGAAKDRAEYFAKALGTGGGKGWMTQNDVRELEDLDRSDDPEADKLSQPIQAGVPADAAPASGSQEVQP